MDFGVPGIRLAVPELVRRQSHDNRIRSHNYLQVLAEGSVWPIVLRPSLNGLVALDRSKNYGTTG
jgi:hypothetical protein